MEGIATVPAVRGEASAKRVMVARMYFFIGFLFIEGGNYLSRSPMSNFFSVAISKRCVIDNKMGTNYYLYNIARDFS